MFSEDRFGKVSRRAFCERLIAVSGAYPLAHYFLFRETEKNGLAMPLSSPAESGLAQVESSAIKYPGTGATIEAYLAKPKGSGPFPAVILVHEDRGLNDPIRDLARRMARAGFVTLAPDLLSRHGGTTSFGSPEEATKALRNAKDDVVIGDLNSAYDYLNRNGSVKKDDVALMGCGPRYRDAVKGLKFRIGPLYPPA